MARPGLEKTRPNGLAWFFSKNQAKWPGLVLQENQAKWPGLVFADLAWPARAGQDVSLEWIINSLKKSVALM